MVDNDVLSIPNRIKGIYNSCTQQEQMYLLQILQELSDHGHSDTYEQLWLADYKEIPVSIDTFIESDLYLGKTNRNGQAVYPHWRDTLRKIFQAGNKYDEVIFTGATRIGKSSTAITATAYMLYKLMCLRDPQKYFNKKEVSKFSILFFNVTKDLAKGVAFREFNDTLKESPWFNQHGTFSLSDSNFYYIPEGGKVVIDYGSSGAHALGQQIFVGFCVVGSTEIVTYDGIKSIESLAGSSKSVLQYDPTSGRAYFVPADVVCTKYVSDTVKITLEDGSVVEGTPEHLIMLADGSYKPLGELTNSDDVLSLNLIWEGDTR